MDILLLITSETLQHYGSAVTLVLALALLSIQGLRQWHLARDIYRHAVVQARAHGVSVEQYMAMVRGLVQAATGLADPLPRALVHRAICEPAYRAQLIERTTLLPIRHFWQPADASRPTIVPPELVLAQVCRRMLQNPPAGRNREMSTHMALAWQLATLMSDVPTQEQAQRIVWDRRYRAKLLAAVDTRPRVQSTPGTISRAY